ncbi:MAG: GAF domain-containing protein [Deferrisomatales bacterium]|nr:GAF domain-containing protein [Deferrisomatales bacterium]
MGEIRLAGDSTQIIERGHLAEATLPADSRRLQVLHSIAEKLVSTLDLDEVLPKVLETLDELFSYDRCAVLCREEDGSLRLHACRPRDTGAPFSRTIADRVFDRGEALLYDDVQGEAPFDLGQSVMGLNIRSVLCSPLVYKGRVNGLVYLDRSVAGAYDLEDLSLLRGASALVAIAVENSRLFGELQTRYRLTAADLRAAELRLLEAERSAALGRLVLAIAHEVRNPVTVIGGLCRRLERHPEEAVGAGVAATVREEAERLERMMGRVEDLISLPEAAVRLAPLGDDVEAVLSDLRPLLTQAGIRVLAPPQEGWGSVSHDPALTRIALVAVLEHVCTGVPRGETVQIRLERRDPGWAIVAGPPLGGPVGPDEPGVTERPVGLRQWVPDLRLALAQRAMEAQGGDVRLSEGGGGGSVVEILFAKERGKSE